MRLGPEDSKRGSVFSISHVEPMVKPYYDEDGITIYHGDCMEVMPGLPVVDAIVTDPPYGETSLKWDIPVDQWLALARRRLIPSGSVWFFTSLKALLNIAPELDGWNVAQELVWEKQNGSGFQADRFKRVHELVVHIYPKDVAWADVFKNPVTTPNATPRQIRRRERPAHMGHIENSTYTSEDGGPRLMRSVIFKRNCHGYAVHEMQKPVGIVSPLIEYSVPRGGLVLDPFMGSGTTLVCAREMGRRSIGVELKESDCEEAVKRLGQAVLPFAQQ